MRFLWQNQHIEYHAAYTNFLRVLHFSALILCCMHAYTVRHCNCAEGTLVLSLNSDWHQDKLVLPGLVLHFPRQPGVFAEMNNDRQFTEHQ